MQAEFIDILIANRLMINRRFLRIKALMQYYSHTQTENKSIVETEKQLLQSINKVYELFIYQLSFLMEVFCFAENMMEEAKNKHLPSEEEKNPNTRFVDNAIYRLISPNKDYKKLLGVYAINWKEDEDIIRKMYKEIRQSRNFQQYMEKPADFEQDKAYIVQLFKAYVTGSRFLHNKYEEMNIHWYDDFYMANNLVIKFIQSVTSDWTEETSFPTLLGEDDSAKNEDLLFVKKLLREAISKDAENEKIISAFLTNWEPDRIALLDMLIMKLAVVEFLYFPSIPVKATLNEYIEVSKEYSTPKSKIFINGVLDKIIKDLKEKGKLNKSGRGLKEN